MTGFVISPWIKKGSVDHRFCNTDSMLKTIELLLGLPPLCQYDAIADPIMDWDREPSNAEAFHAIRPSKDLIAETTPPKSSLTPSDPRLPLLARSERMDFSHADAAPARELNEIVWRTVKGPGSTMPAPRGWADDDD
jgi:hypothetical protein